MVVFWQTTIALQPRSRGCHLVSDEIKRALAKMPSVKVGLANIFLQHTSASLTINENCDPDVRKDMEMSLNNLAPEDADYIHTDEGKDDMPGHVKSSLFGCSLTIPVTDSKLNLGTWQGIWLCEHRNRGGSRRVVITIQGQ
ncbi:hypothetical protein BASA50_009543 [Batrachochytrium salamandrivorans]|uniref:Secondary thiamine-phosphate synthase enzyme n=1 Tax=Batrachochytrium salamandrivorans TaxID=1357716 RepID=A0ABQ8F1R6_9FUNG|nr:hypothetical protein BASA62_009744 [Batrachochytrium salamandrivorans]KAH6561832.1 hypothetical protein BASA60_011336 [Batrachochytrium salamandrivorans]KAH6586751.1 hypothetical protein BASA61_006462 [Batrachochytrium salamandrivorans]KAH6590283.1 hypothetical protein BASA50_009543 [Batrachochytrium salamandrivorans]KAH9275213.1 secondary thiamine-phosphate synthase enzyme [Batrachochytrium salamandrivorans]